MSEITPANIAADIVVDRCLAIIQDKTNYVAPATPAIALAPEERAKLGLSGDSETYFYGAGDTGVFLDLAPKMLMVWFNGGDCDKGLELLDRKLKQVYPRTRQIGDIETPATPGTRGRMYEVDLSGGLLAWIEANYPAPGSKARKFTVRIEPRKRSA
ncbi:MAG: hypothetical protein JNL81_06470 [Hyphomonadaceae bacterium]|nr:hypothetical protein [Hyphomonadaceae bacterium]